MMEDDPVRLSPSQGVFESEEDASELWRNFEV
jgi:hypothetical protein